MAIAICNKTIEPNLLKSGKRHAHHNLNRKDERNIYFTLTYVRK